MPKMFFLLALTSLAIAQSLEQRMRRVVERLCRQELEGRVSGTPGAALAADDLARLFEKSGLQPWGDSFKQELDLEDGTSGTNVVGWIPGRGGVAGPFLLIGAHYDGAGYVDGFFTPGADHNASALAVMQEVATSLVADGEARNHGIIFAAFDMGLRGRKGSEFFLSSVGAENLSVMINLEILGGNPVSGLANQFFALGSESASFLDGCVHQVKSTLDVMRGGIYLIESQGARGDYEVFQKNRIPFLYVSSGVTRNFNKASDTPASLDYDKMAAITAYLTALSRRLASSESSDFRDTEDVAPTLEETRSVKDLLKKVIAARAELDLSAATVEALEKRAQKIQALLDRGEIPLRKKRYLQKTLEMILLIIVQSPAS